MTTQRPLPVRDALSAEYWAAAERHTLVLARCSECAAFALPPEPTCRLCGTSTPAFRYERVAGHATVRSWTVVHRATLRGFADLVPYLLVDAELAEQPEVRMIGRLMNGPETTLQVGDPVRIAFEDVADGVAIPAFVLDDAAGPAQEAAS